MLFHYQCDFAVKYRSLVNFVCIVCKHRMKVREQGFVVTVAAAEKGREAMVSFNKRFMVGDTASTFHLHIAC